MSYSVEYAEMALRDRRARVKAQRRAAAKVSVTEKDRGIWTTLDGRWAIICEADPEPQPVPGQPPWDPMYFVVPAFIADSATLDDAVMETDTLRAAKAWIDRQDRVAYLAQAEKIGQARAKVSA
jgi:hypothetical protein